MKKKFWLTPLGAVIDKIAHMDGLNTYKVMMTLEITDYKLYEKILDGNICPTVGQLQRMIQMHGNAMTYEDESIIENEINKISARNIKVADLSNLEDEEVVFIQELILKLIDKRFTSFITELKDFIDASNK